MYAEVTVTINGALEEEKTFTDETVMDNYIALIKFEAEFRHFYPTSVWVRYHDHDEGLECECAQYEQDHNPTHEFNQETIVLTENFDD